MDQSVEVLRNQYMQISALTPEKAQAISAVDTGTHSFLDTIANGGLPLSLAIFFILLTLGIISLLITRVADVNKILTLSFLALVTSAIPYGTKLATEPTRLQSRASLLSIPKNVIIRDVGKEAFTVSWSTDNPGTGAIRLRTDSNLDTNQKVYSETTSAQEHTLIISKLKPNTTYYFEILSAAEWYNHNGAPLQVSTLP